MTPAPEALPLRDIHLPDPVGWWPPAPGWWGLMLLCLLLLAVIRTWIGYRRRGRLKLHSLILLQQLVARFEQSGDEQRLIADLSVLLRRVAISVFPRRQVASLTGVEWLRFLDQSLTPGGTDKAFTEGVGRILLDAPYKPACRVDRDALIGLIRRWISANTGQGRS